MFSLLIKYETSIHHSLVFPYLLHRIQVCREAGAYPSCHQGAGAGEPWTGRLSITAHTEKNKTNNHVRLHLLLWSIQNHQLTYHACFWAVGIWSTQREPTHARGRTCNLHTVWPLTRFEPAASCCEVSALTTTPPKKADFPSDVPSGIITLFSRHHFKEYQIPASTNTQ